MTPEVIAEIAALIVQGGNLAMNLFLKLEPLLHLGSDEKVNIANAIASSKAADADTIASATAWMQSHGFVMTFVPAPVAPPAP